MSPSTFSRSGVVALLALTAFHASAQAGDNLPAVQSHAGIEMISGGVGKDESYAIRHAAKRWPLLLEFAQNHHGKALYTAGVDVKLMDHTGHELTRVRSDGPLMLLRVKPGTYRVEAALDGHAQRHSVAVPPTGNARLSFVWPYGVK